MRIKYPVQLLSLNLYSPAFFRVNTEQMFIVFLVTDWASRCKQIMKIWRKVSAADKVPYLVSSFFLTLKNNTFMFTNFSLQFF